MLCINFFTPNASHLENAPWIMADENLKVYECLASAKPVISAWGVLSHVTLTFVRGVVNLQLSCTDEETEALRAAVTFLS